MRSGMPIAEALATAPNLVAHEEDPRKDAQALERLAAWAERYSPIVGVEPGPAPECLLLDVTGCAAYFRGEDSLAQRVVRELHQQEWISRVAIADTLGAAWGLAHHVRTFYVAPSGETEKIVLALPVAALRLPDEVLETLKQLGIERIEQLVSLPRAELPGRFGGLVLQRLDQIMGRVPELIVPHRFLPDVQARCTFEYPTEQLKFLHYALDRLLEQVTRALRQRHRGARRLECWFYHETAEPTRIEVGLFRPSRSPAHLRKLLQTRLEQVRLTEPVIGLCLHVPAVDLLPEHQFGLYETDEPRTLELSTLIDSLVSRLGREAVTFPALVPDPQPEYACRFEPAIAACGLAPKCSAKPRAADLHVFVHRPLQMQPVPVPIEVMAVAPEGPPARLRWANEDYTILRAWGPERIETGWWRGQDVHRDYYIVETERGTRLWIFRRQDDGRWFLHGCFD